MMENNILTDNTVVYYVVQVNGQSVSPQFTSLMLAEMEKAQLAPNVQTNAEIVPVTAEGKRVLLG